MNSQSLLSLLLVVFIVGAGAAGVIFTIKRRRAVREGDFVRCKNCGYDVQGLRIADSEPSLCSECGTPLFPSAVRRQSAWVTRRASVVSLLLSLSGMLAFLVWNGGNWSRNTRLLPTPALILQSKIDTADRWGTISELAARGTRGELSADQLGVLAARGLDIQASDRPWKYEWGDLIEQARAAGRIDDQTWISYIERAIVADFEPEREAVIGKPIVMQVGLGADRGSGNGRWVGSVSAEIKYGGVGDDQASERFLLSVPGHGRGANTFSRHLPEGLGPGDHVISTTIKVRMFETMGDLERNALMHEFERTLEKPLRVHAAGYESHRFKFDAATAERIAAAVRIDQIALREVGGDVMASISFAFSDLPIAVGFEVKLRVNDESQVVIEKPLGLMAMFVIPAGHTVAAPRAYPLNDARPLISALAKANNRVDVVLVPTLDAARAQPNLNEIWGGEPIVIPGITVDVDPKFTNSNTP